MEKRNTKNESNDIFTTKKVKHLGGDWTRPVGELKETDDDK